jgi:uncharacterized membrane protein YphA (DoxX/SURF4 family)
VSAATAADLALLVFRAGLGAVFLAHGCNHIFGVIRTPAPTPAAEPGRQES